VGRATRYLRKFYPWYVARLHLDPQPAKELLRSLQTADTLGGVRGLLGVAAEPLAAAV
jgi:hypothetical protein